MSTIFKGKFECFISINWNVSASGTRAKFQSDYFVKSGQSNVTSCEKAYLSDWRKRYLQFFKIYVDLFFRTTGCTTWCCDMTSVSCTSPLLLQQSPGFNYSLLWVGSPWTSWCVSTYCCCERTVHEKICNLYVFYCPVTYLMYIFVVYEW